MPVSLIAPDADNYQVGKGIVSFKPDGAADYIDLGNVAELEYTPNIEKLDHYSSRAGTRTKDKSVVQTRSGTLRILMEELTAQNLSMLLMGTVDDAAVGGPNHRHHGNELDPRRGEIRRHQRRWPALGSAVLQCRIQPVRLVQPNLGRVEPDRGDRRGVVGDQRRKHRQDRPCATDQPAGLAVI